MNNPNKVYFKVFTNSNRLSHFLLDAQINEWLEKRPKIRVLDYQYATVYDGHNVERSICIRYEVVNDDKEE